MNRRGFISLLAGGAGAALVPWRGLVDPVIALPPVGGWVAHSLGDLWLNYANHIRPAGILATSRVDASLDTPWVVEELLGRAEVSLRIAADIPSSLERKMRSVLLKQPATFHPWATLADFAPWEFDPGTSYIVEKSQDIRRIDSLSRII